MTSGPFEKELLVQRDPLRTSSRTNRALPIPLSCLASRPFDPGPAAVMSNDLSLNAAIGITASRKTTHSILPGP
ncbi:hypothetical protein [Phyllobacterium zundukense]|uniref:Uncharacterized protein n=1 Tax=Phyllobacterium zundukense TaxID=1867719 RepID=A0A2N9VYX4_9HYPH|nr:hypothetical protein [Phyllobacterium zundukense]ATU95271.1 hypothetical protein BLM14_26485 [Phyllobacterium zundukense]PIO44692.1 hypothetical protein B5P45_12645 [Phyllobacterium zundukense]